MSCLYIYKYIQYIHIMHSECTNHMIIQTHLVVPQEMGGFGAPAELQDVQHVEGTATAFAALLGNGNVVCWGHPMLGQRKETTERWGHVVVVVVVVLLLRLLILLLGNVVVKGFIVVYISDLKIRLVSNHCFFGVG